MTHEPHQQQSTPDEPDCGPNTAVLPKLLSQRTFFFFHKDNLPSITDIFLCLLFCANCKSHAPHLPLNCKGQLVMITMRKQLKCT